MRYYSIFKTSITAIALLVCFSTFSQKKDDSKKEIRLTRLKRLEKKLKSNILKRKKAINKNG